MLDKKSTSIWVGIAVSFMVLVSSCSFYLGQKDLEASSIEKVSERVDVLDKQILELTGLIREQGVQISALRNALEKHMTFIIASENENKKRDKIITELQVLVRLMCEKHTLMKED